MSAYDPDQYRPMIDAILSVADLEEITVKRIRNALQELFAVDLQPHKEEIKDVILQRYYKFLDEKENKKDDEVKKEREYQDHLLAQRLSRSENNRPLTRRGGSSKVVKKKVTKRTGKTPNTAFNKELVLSPQLQEVVKSERLSRPQVVKQMWAYIKENNLQDQSDKRKIHCDEKLKNVFKKSSVGMFEMNKILGDHFIKDDELLNGNGHEAPNSEEETKPNLKRETVSDESDISDVDD